MNVRNRLRVVRAEQRITQETLEARLRKYKISQTTISNIENGLHEPDAKEQRRIARALKVPVEVVFPPEQVNA